MSIDAFPDFQAETTNGYIDFLHEHTPTDVDAYMEQKATEIAAGLPTWIVRNFSSDARVYDLYINKKHFGFIDQEDQMAEAYVIEEDGQPALDISFETDVLQDNLMAAKQYIEGVAETCTEN